MASRLLPVGIHRNVHVGHLHGWSAVGAAELSLVICGQQSGGAVQIQVWLNQSAPNHIQLEPLLGHHSILRQFLPERVFHNQAERDTALRGALLGIAEQRFRDANGSSSRL